MYKRILLATDGSECSMKAAKYAIETARQNQAELIALSVTETKALQNLPVEELTRKVTELFRRESEEVLERVEELASSMEGSVKVRKMILEGPSADTILRVADEEGVDLIVVGASGKHALERFILGSVSEKVVRHSTVPVLVVHSKKQKC
ncbi:MULTISPECIES: universal stress protein [Methanothermobacter]|uniref:Predicted universal stress protein n=1 Tax=Methanothermobacter marburgensis (strain ATCC BAA-927 / DSM 2133 / JCM 14651 / NBRC 100331 / OCM 82 / Marburg) TaxID=79929 RepID=D9PXD3_METTM|nr:MULTISPECIES: universal stress protein [Methanothermobacter]ADL58881.1 predicted universal stress protein [Methanothermobacter marburgensis str. Marburg]QHN07332.1 universal stress protein [Methanothermobacter sp. THM-2]WBF09426.1 universal stress protein [Methanothermobacter marburgensis]